MRRVLLATMLLSIATCESIPMENYLRPTMWVREKQFWSKTKRLPHIPPKMEEIMSYEDDKQFPRISDARLIGEPVNLPSLAIIRRPELLQVSQSLLPAAKSKLNSVKPAVSISIGIQESRNLGDASQRDCATSRQDYRRFNQDWQFQQPFYVEEPQWIEIDADYMDGSVRHLNSGDPYILSRGKKFRMKDQQQVEKRFEDYEEILDYSGRSNEPSARNRVRRSVKENEESWTADSEGKKDRLEDEKSFKIDEEAENGEDVSTRDLARDVVVRKYEGGDDDVDDDKINSGKATSREGHFENSNLETVRADNKFTTDVKNGSERSLINEIFHETQEKHRNSEIDSINSNRHLEEKGIVLEERKNIVHLDKLNNLGVYNDPFVLSRDKKAQDDKARDHDEYFEKQQASSSIKHYDAHGEDKQAIELNSNGSGTRSLSNSRTKRGVYKIEPEFQKDLWLENEKRLEKESAHLKTRNKHSNALDLRTFSVDPYFIVRGKKTPYEKLENALYHWSTERRNELEGDDRAELRNFSMENPLRRTMLVKKCDNDNCGIDIRKLLQSMSNSRDRRDKLDKILGKYDPFVIVRGKRVSPDDLQIDGQFGRGGES